MVKRDQKTPRKDLECDFHSTLYIGIRLSSKHPFVLSVQNVLLLPTRGQHVPAW